MSINQLTLKQLRAFVAVYRLGRLQSAADALNVTQSAISVLIRQIESSLGTQLFDRTMRSLIPTVAAENAIGIAERILRDVESLDVTFQELRDLQRGHVRLTVTPATGMALLPATVSRFRLAYPGVSFILDDCAPNQFLSNIREEKVEFGIGTPPRNRDEFDILPVHDDPLVLACPRQHRLADRQHVRWTDLDGVPLVLSRREYGVREVVEATLMRVGVEANIGSEIGFLGSATWLASCGLGLCILPSRLAPLFLTQDLVIRPLVEPEVRRMVAVMTRKGRSLSPPCQQFVTMLMEDQGSN